MMIDAVILIFERIGQEEYKTVPYINRFSKYQSISEILEWVKSIDPDKGIKDVYFNDVKI